MTNANYLSYFLIFRVIYKNSEPFFGLKRIKKNKNQENLFKIQYMAKHDTVGLIYA